MFNIRLSLLTVLVLFGIVTVWQNYYNNAFGSFPSSSSSQATNGYMLLSNSHNNDDDDDDAKKGGGSGSSSSSSSSSIPNIVHFVQLKKDETSELHFPFEAFLALYAAHRFIRPSTIYIHTDFSREEIASAQAHGSTWTRKVLTAFPEVVRMNPVTAPTEVVVVPPNGDGDGGLLAHAAHAGGETPPLARPIQRVEHRSDFVRLDQLARLGGGVYLDWDVITLRPVAPLRHAGFRAVVGRQFDTFVNNGILLAAPDSGLVEIMRAETPRVFDGGWITHSVSLLTRVANRLASVPGEVLIMDAKAFAPFEWSQASVDYELERHEGDAVQVEEEEKEDQEEKEEDKHMHAAVEGGSHVAVAKQAWEAGLRRKERKKDWEYDFSDAYFLHKFYNDVDDPKGFHGVSVPYILARDSNYALATWPIVMQAISEGAIDPKDTSL